VTTADTVQVTEGKYQGVVGVVERIIANKWADGRVYLVRPPKGEPFWIREDMATPVLTAHKPESTAFSEMATPTAPMRAIPPRVRRSDPQLVQTLQQLYELVGEALTRALSGS
jgi:hypothetical protein